MSAFQQSAPTVDRTRPDGAYVSESGVWALFANTDSVQEFCQAWLAIECRSIFGVTAGLLLLQEHERSYVPAAVWPDPAQDVTYLGKVAESGLLKGQGLVRAHERPDGTTTMLVAYPIEIDARLLGVVVLEAAPRPEGELQALIRGLTWGSGWLEAFFRRHRAAQDAQRMDRAAIAMDAVAVVGEGSRLQESTMALVNELAKRVGCERVSIGLEREQRVHLQAMSHSAWFDRKSQLVVNLENAMEEALDQRKTVSYPAVQGLPHAISVAHRDIAAGGAVCSVVVASRGRCIGVVTLERRAGAAAFTQAEVELAQAAASLVGPILDLESEAQRWFAGRIADRLRRFGRDLADPRRPSFRIASAAAIAGALFLAFAEGEYRIAAKSVIEGEVQRSLVAPFEGFIAEAPVRAGQTVTTGVMLTRLDDRDLRVEEERLRSEREQHLRKYRDALARHERSSARVLSAQIAETDAKLKLVDEKLTRTQIRAPFDGIVVNGDLSHMLGSPVEQGKVLFELAPLDAYRVILKVDERDIRDVAPGQHGSLVLSGLAGEALPFTVKNVSVATAEEGGNFFRVEAQLEHPLIKLRPGMEGVGKIVVGERRLAWIWTHRLMDWLRLKLWGWMP